MAEPRLSQVTCNMSRAARPSPDWVPRRCVDSPLNTGQHLHLHLHIPLLWHCAELYYYRRIEVGDPFFRWRSRHCAQHQHRHPCYLCGYWANDQATSGYCFTTAGSSTCSWYEFADEEVNVERSYRLEGDRPVPPP